MNEDTITAIASIIAIFVIVLLAWGAINWFSKDLEKTEKIGQAKTEQAVEDYVTCLGLVHNYEGTHYDKDSWCLSRFIFPKLKHQPFETELK